MGAFVSLDEPLLGYMSVDLCRLQAGVTEKLLHHPEVGTTVKKVRGKGVPQGVGVGRRAAPTVQEAPDVPRAQTAAPTVDEGRTGRSGRPDQPTTAVPEPPDNGAGRGLRHWHRALLCTFSPDRDQPPVRVELVYVEATKLRDPQPAAVKQFENRVVA